MRPNLRLLTALLTLLHLAVAGAVSVLHVAAEGPRVEAGAHLHAPDDAGDCPAPHDDAHCPACRYAGETPDAPPAPRWRVADGLRRGAVSLPSRVADPSARPASQPGSRAPPRA